MVIMSLSLSLSLGAWGEWPSFNPKAARALTSGLIRHASFVDAGGCKFGFKTGREQEDAAQGGKEREVMRRYRRRKQRAEMSITGAEEVPLFVYPLIITSHWSYFIHFTHFGHLIDCINTAGQFDSWLAIRFHHLFSSSFPLPLYSLLPLQTTSHCGPDHFCDWWCQRFKVNPIISYLRLL